MSTFPDMLYQMGGVPVDTTSRYAGWWNQDTYFVDYDHAPGGDGRSMATAKKYLANAISSANAWDVIYVRPRDPDATGGDANAITPESTTNWSIPYAKHGLSIIGTTIGRCLYHTYLKGSANTTTPAFTCSAPLCVFENLAFHRGSGTKPLFIDGYTSSTGYAWGNTITNCMFRFANAAGGVDLDSSYYSKIYNSQFYRCTVGIMVHSNKSTPRCMIIQNNIFENTAAGTEAHIVVANADYITIDNNIFNSPQPTAGIGKYIHIVTTSDGIVSNNVFAVSQLTEATIMTLSGLLTANNQAKGGWCDD